MNARTLCHYAIVLAALAGAAHAAGPKSIFDDDWVPPKPVTAPPSADPAANPATADPATKPPVGDPAVQPPTVPPAPAAHRLPVPDRAAQAAVRKLMRDVFAEQLADASPAARRKLAQNLLAQAERSADAPVDRFVLLAAAVDAGVEGGRLPLAFRAADALAAAYEVDALAVKAEKVALVTAKSITAGEPTVSAAAVAVESHCAAGLALADRLVAADAYVDAARLLASLQSLAGSADDPEKLRARLQKRARDLGAARAAHDQVARHVEELKAAPDDPAANLAVGAYLCFTKGDWAAGLPKLFKGGDAKLKRAAELEMLKPQSAEDRALLADLWWDAAPAAPVGMPRLTVQLHAAQWYAQASRELKGLAKAQAEKRMESARVAALAAGISPPAIDILALVGARAHTTMGKWTASANALECTEPEGRIILPYVPPEEYDLTVVFVRSTGHDSMNFFLPMARGAVVWFADGWGKGSGLVHTASGNWDIIDKHDSEDAPGQLTNNVTYTFLARVRKDHVEVSLDGKVVYQRRTDGTGYRNPWAETGKGQSQLGLQAKGVSVFSKVELTPISGRGHEVE